MKSAVETLSPTRVRLTVEVPFEELSPSFEAAYREIARQVTIPGFRRGKIPRQIIDQRFGRQTVLDQAVNDAIPRLYFDAIQENDVEPMGQPTLDVGSYEDGADLTFTAEVEVRPEVSLPEYKGLEVSVDDADVGDETVDEQVNGLRERFGSLSTVERPAGDDDYVTLDLSASKDGEPIEEAQAKGMSYQIGSGSLLDGLDDAVRGKAAGESATFVSKLVSGDYAGQDVDIDVKVDTVKEQQLPDLDDDFAQLASEFDTLEELRTDLYERLERVQRIQQAQQARDAVLEKLLELVDIPLPEGAVAGEIDARRDGLREQLTSIGMSVEQYLQREGQSEEEFDEDLAKRARDAMKAQFVLDKVADVEELSVSEAELTQALVQRAQQAGVSPDDYAKQVVEANYVPTLVREVRRGKALATVVGQCGRHRCVRSAGRAQAAAARRHVGPRRRGRGGRRRGRAQGRSHETPEGAAETPEGAAEATGEADETAQGTDEPAGEAEAPTVDQEDFWCTCDQTSSLIMGLSQPLTLQAGQCRGDERPPGERGAVMQDAPRQSGNAPGRGNAWNCTMTDAAPGGARRRRCRCGGTPADTCGERRRSPRPAGPAAPE